MNDGNTELSEQDLAYNRKLLVNCLNQQTRDLIVMCIRVFALKNYKKIDKALEGCSDEIGKYHTDVYLELEETLREMHALQDENLALVNKNKLQKAEIKRKNEELRRKNEEHQRSLSTSTRADSEEIEKMREEIAYAIASKERLRERYSQKRKEAEEIKKKIEELICKENQASDELRR